MDSQDCFQVIYSSQRNQDSYQEQIMQSIREEEKKGAEIKIFQVIIKPSKNQIDLNLLENQYYQFQVYKYRLKYATIQRRFSEFALIFQILSKKQPGLIFPAFPQNGIFAFMKTKVTMIKDESFINTRIKVIERFFNIILNWPEFIPQVCDQIKVFISEGKQFQARKQIQKGTGGVFGYFNKIKTLLTISKQNKYKENQDRILTIKTQYESLYVKCRELIELLHQQKLENTKFKQIEDSNHYFLSFKQLIYLHDQKQQENFKELQEIQFQLFCQNEDLLMAKKVIDRLNQLKKNQDNYTELKKTEEQFSQQIKTFLQQKTQNLKTFQQKFKKIIAQVKDISRNPT